ncbi:hypothetical protein ETB97_001414 [Aspergillus alliaceus]|uniref:FAD dependent oxidoreductase domain-containing protein n=1 Tax=Petromyces alliaceus TaxID=209559 RepID=A0A8H6A3V4_PETAA|nr:hypothetical protein ETB97_001414 [Aspergillus burnettii]
MEVFARKCVDAGVSFTTGERGTVVSLVLKEKMLVGVKVATGETLPCARVILATGSWTSHLLDLRGAAVLTCNPVASIRLSKDETAELSKQPVICNLPSGVFVFPPTPNGILKVARHDYGYETTMVARSRPCTQPWSSTSAPKLVKSHFTTNFIPDKADTAFRAGLTLLLPRFKDRPWIKRKLCWYSDTRNGDFIVDYHPSISGLFLATGDSGHCFKFLPVICGHVSDIFEDKTPGIHRARWVFKPTDKPMASASSDGSRGGPPRRVLTRSEQAKL